MMCLSINTCIVIDTQHPRDVTHLGWSDGISLEPGRVLLLKVSGSIHPVPI